MLQSLRKMLKCEPRPSHVICTIHDPLVVPLLTHTPRALRLGKNEIAFTVYSDLQGAQTVRSRVFLWEQSAKLVISDIDGGGPPRCYYKKHITESDAP